MIKFFYNLYDITNNIFLLHDMSDVSQLDKNICFLLLIWPKAKWVGKLLAKRHCF